MIKIYGDTFYMTAGEACYILRSVGGVPKNVCFGRRVELEDDIPSLGVECGVSELPDMSLQRGGRSVSKNFKLVDGRVEETKPTYRHLPRLRGGKTLILTLEDSKAELKLELCYTTYPRGGISRRSIITNMSEQPLTLKKLSSGGIAAAGGILERRDKAFAVIHWDGGALGAYMLYRQASCAVSESDGMTAVQLFAELGGGITLAGGESFISPEVLLVYSDNGVGGIIRAYHDIFREFGMSPEMLARRRPIVLYCPTGGGVAFERRVAAAAQTGIDTIAVDHEPERGREPSGLKDYALKCAENGIKFGVRIKLGGGYDLSDAKSSEAAAQSIISIIAATGAEFVKLDVATAFTSYMHESGLHLLLNALTDAYPELAIEFGAGGSPRELHITPVPLCVKRGVIELPPRGERSLKTEFDLASFGAMGYEFDPVELSDGVRLAVRAQVFSYQDDAGTVKLGDLYNIGGGIMAVSKDKSKAYAVASGSVRLVGLDEHNIYHVRELDKTYSGAALIYYGLAVESDGETRAFHIRQVVDYDG